MANKRIKRKKRRYYFLFKKLFKMINLIIIAVMFISVNIFGQSRDIYSADHTILTIVSEYERYESECYSDSMVVGYRFIEDEGYFEDGRVSWCKYTVFYILLSHPRYDPYRDYPEGDFLRIEEIKEPEEEPTLSGYMNWLKAKMEE